VSVAIRPARPDDAPAVAAIYNERMAGRQATFETRPREPGEVLEWLVAGYPFLVVDRLLGPAAGDA
jgi:phosphinothricin acetyltransferase